MTSRALLNRLEHLTERSPISAIDLFCGAGGLTHGLLRAGIKVEAGVDIDEDSQHAYETNNPGTAFKAWDLANVEGTAITGLFTPDKIQLLAGCAPCQPFSKLTNGKVEHEAFDLLDNFGRLIRQVKPDLVTMENVPELKGRGKPVLDRFIRVLDTLEYEHDFDVVFCPEYGIPQARHRLVLLASRLGKIKIPKGPYLYPSRWKTVERTIGLLPAVKAGGSDPEDRLHVAVKLTDINVKRIRATPKNGGSWRDWDPELVLKCHKRKSGQRYGSIYGRMRWDEPAPTMTTLCTGIGNGRFGHPEQNRAITLREAALFQTFPRSYEFWPETKRLNRSAISRMIGNAVPPRLAEALGKALIKHVAKHAKRH